MANYKLLLDNSLFCFDMNGKRIPHSVNAGPQIACKTCGNFRCGKDFTDTLYGGQVVQLDECIYCASKRSTRK